MNARRPMLAVSVGLLLAACGSSAPASPVAPSATPAARPTVDPGTSAAAVGPSPAAAAPGLIAFDRFDGAFGAEGPYLGSSIARSDGSEEQAITVPIEVAGLLPTWSPDGSRLLLSTWVLPTGPERPAVMNADGSGFERFDPAGVDGDLGCSDWSPVATSLACWVIGNEPDADGLYLLSSDGASLTRLTTSPYHYTEGSAGGCGGGDGRAVFSPDGSKVAFIRQRCGTGANPSSDESAAIMLIKSDGTEPREIVAQGGVMSHPGSQLSWSPDGSRIVFGSQTGELFLVQPDGTGLSRVRLPSSLGVHRAYGPDWSPDGTRIAFSMYVDAAGSTDLYSVSPDGSDLSQVTDTVGAEAFVRWGPDLDP